MLKKISNYRIPLNISPILGTLFGVKFLISNTETTVHWNKADQTSHTLPTNFKVPLTSQLHFLWGCTR